MGAGASACSDNLATYHVLIIGGGYAGIQAASNLDKAGIPFTLVDPKEYFHHCVGALRAAVSPEYLPKTAIPFRDAYGERFVQGKVVTLDVPNKKAVLEGGREVGWTHCLVAVGSLGPAPGRSVQTSIAGLEEEAKAMAENIAQADKIAIIGGGPVGVELAGEIRDKYKEKTITIISSNEKLVSPDFSERFDGRVKDLMAAGDIKVGDTEVTAQLVVTCVGAPPATPELARLLPAASIDEKGRVVVDELLGVQGCPGVFGLGDCCNTQEHKMAAHAGAHSDVVVKNIQLEAAGKPGRPYKQKFVGMLVPFGASAGVGSINGWTLPSFAVVKGKSADLFTTQFWTTMGLKDKMPK